MEAHGGYSFCGLAALMFLNKGHLCNTDALLKWAANRQMRVEGGFQVRAFIIIKNMLLNCQQTSILGLTIKVFFLYTSKAASFGNLCSPFG